jgi:hypothetical protein
MFNLIISFVWLAVIALTCYLGDKRYLFIREHIKYRSLTKELRIENKKTDGFRFSLSKVFAILKSLKKKRKKFE